MNTLKRKLCAAQKRLSEAHAEIDTRAWERRNADTALHETSRLLESQRVELCQANQLTHQAQRENGSPFGEMNVRNEVAQEDRANDCQDIEELRSICCEKADKASN